MENTTQYKGHTIKIVNDENSDSPRSWDNLGTMICWHRRYNLGDKHNFETPEDFQEYIESLPKSKRPIVLPLYLYDHSGITIATKPFSCRWDSGQVGYIYIEKEKIKQEYGNAGKKNIETATRVLEGEVETYDQYLRGDVYGFIVEKEGEHLDSCYGFYGENEALEEAKSVVDYEVKKAIKNHFLKLKELIKNKVGLDCRKPCLI